jgi:hypothetical protein
MARAMLAIIAPLLSSPVQAQVLYLSCAGGVVLVPGVVQSSPEGYSAPAS